MRCCRISGDACSGCLQYSFNIVYFASPNSFALLFVCRLLCTCACVCILRLQAQPYIVAGAFAVIMLLVEVVLVVSRLSRADAAGLTSAALNEAAAPPRPQAAAAAAARR